MKIASIESVCVNVSAKTNWFFIVVTADDGLVGIGEASLNGWEPLLFAQVNELAQSLRGAAIEEWRRYTRVYPHGAGGLVAAAATSALEQAVTDIRAQAAGQPIHALLGGARRKSVRVYANINRGAVDRTPAGCAASAVAAVEEGFRAIKIAPFDGVLPHALDPNKIELGIERVEAMRSSLGPDIDLMVDCHWRFDEPSALRVIDALAPMKLMWIECPISERTLSHDALARVRERANHHGMLLAGAETQIGTLGFEPFVARKLFDVLMPDVKYAGGYYEILAIARQAQSRGIRFSPHNPTGPICNMASIHLAACAENFLILEYQHAESPFFFELVHGVKPSLVGGEFVVPQTSGLGVTLDLDAARCHPYRAVSPGLDPSLG